MQMRRFTRLTNAFSKKVENLKSAIALHFAHYNFVRVHSALRMTPAVALGIVPHSWQIERTSRDGKLGHYPTENLFDGEMLQ
jgi:hypothetical protein